MNKLLLILLFLGLTGCLLSEPFDSGQDYEEAGVADPTDPNFSDTQQIYWYLQSDLGLQISVNAQTSNSIRLRGQEVHDLLKSNPKYKTSGIFCASFFFNVAGLKKQLRLRAIALKEDNALEGSVEEMLLIDTSNPSANESFCGETSLAQRGVNGQVLNDVITISDLAFTTSELCDGQSCFSTVEADHMELYHISDEDVLNESKSISEKLSLSDLSFSVDFSNTTTETASDCSTNSQCSSRGFDCCNSGQCVNDGEIIIGAQSRYPEDYETALQEVQNNPSLYVQYPHIYHSCLAL